jgi:hypothetical protein
MTMGQQTRDQQIPLPGEPLLRSDPVLTVVTSKSRCMGKGDMVPLFPPSSAVDKVYTAHFTPPTTTLAPTLLS